MGYARGIFEGNPPRAPQNLFRKGEQTEAFPCEGRCQPKDDGGVVA